MAVNSTALEIFDQDFMQDPHRVFARLREEGSVHQVLTPSSVKVWLVTRYEDVRAALVDPRLQKDGGAVMKLGQRHRLDPAKRTGVGEELMRHMLNTDPPDHTRLRKLVGKAFTARRVEELEPQTERIVAGLLDAIPAGEPVDLVEALASPLPVTTICELLGVPEEDRADFLTWSGILLNDAVEEVAQPAREMSAYLVRLVASKRAHPADDLLSALIEASDNDDRLDEVELLATTVLLLVAGHETVRNLIGSGTLALLRNPDQLAALRTDPGLLPAAIEEFLRYDAPLAGATWHFTTEPVDIGGTTIPEGELVLLSLAAANRDPDRFPDPDRLDITRPVGGHLAFGHGIHHCIGMRLARMEGRIAFTQLLRRFPNMRLAVPDDDLTWRFNTLLHGLQSLPLILE